MADHSTAAAAGCRRQHVAIEIEPAATDSNLVTSILQQMETVSSLHSICRASPTRRESSKKSYTPQKVAIGPYHRDGATAAEPLRPMEDHKWRYVHALLGRRTDLEASLNDCVSALRELEQRSRACYAGDDVDLPAGDEFVKVMFLDGCFIIELFLKYSTKVLRRRNDPIFAVPGMLYDLRCDLALLENQIPLFVLQRLFQVVPIPKQCANLSLAELAFRFFKNMIPGDILIHREKFTQEGNHLLDLICHCLLPTLPRLPSSKSQKHLRSVTDLHSSGIKIKRAKTENLLDVKFVNGILKLPQIEVHQHTELLFRNLIALEQCSNVHGTVHHVTSYVVLVASLIESERDVKFLRQRGILTSYDDDDNGGEKEAGIRKLFGKLCEEVELNESYYDGLCERVNGHRGKNLRALKKKLKRRRNNGSRPTLRLVMLFTVLVLLIAIVGTLFSVLTFVHHHI
ncbi:unnamed protein product [Linum trigynum]|uniref:Uncharacterized protein n=1 Tax=Linum trigynum TaxID=586398 RepID=A0AAV2GQN4_9ROSI